MLIILEELMISNVEMRFCFRAAKTAVVHCIVYIYILSINKFFLVSIYWNVNKHMFLIFATNESKYLTYSYLNADTKQGYFGQVTYRILSANVSK